MPASYKRRRGQCAMQTTLDGSVLSNVNPIVTGVVYKIFESKDPSYVLHRVPYIGQTRGVGSPEFVAKRRWKGEISTYKKSTNLVGLNAMLRESGSENCTFEIIEHKTGPRSEIMKWLNTMEIKLIAQNGGPLRDMEKKLHQTLNLTIGGAVKESMSLEAREAQLLQMWRQFVKHIEEAIRDNGTIDTPRSYACTDGYKFGDTVARIINDGDFLFGRPAEASRRKFLEQQPGWRKKRSYSEAATQREAKIERETPGFQQQRQKEFIANARATGQLMEAAKKQKSTKSSSIWKEKASETQKAVKKANIESGIEAARIEKHHQTTMRKRQSKLDACKTSRERIELMKKFAKSDKDIEDKRKRRESVQGIGS